MAVTFSKVVAAGPGWTTVRGDDGREYTVRGTRAWRNNNPGNIEYGAFAKKNGAIGSDGRFAVFPSYEAGRAAKESLVFDTYPNRYGEDLTISQAISKYAPAFENNSTFYASSIAASIGVPVSTRIKDIPENKRGAFMDAMQRVEGYRVGTINGQQGEVIPPANFAMAGGAQPTPQQQESVFANLDAPTPTEAPRGLLTAYDEPAPTFAENMRNTWLDGLFSTPSAQADPLPPVPSSPGRTMVPDSFQDVPIMSGGHLPLVNAGAADPSPTLPISYDTMGVPDWAFQSSEFAKSPENHQALPAQHPIYDQLLARGAEYQQQPSSGLAGLFSTPSAAAADLPPQPAVPASVAANPESYLPGEMMLGDWASMPSMPSYAMAQAPVQPPVQPLAHPRQVAQRQVAEPPPPPPMPSGMDVWQGQSSYGMATDGSTLSRNPDGTVSRYSEQYDRWDTYNPQTDQWLPGGGQTGSINLPSKDRLLSGGKNMAGSMAGGLLGSYLGGPIGGLLGAALGKSVAQGKGLQGIFGGDKTTVFPAAPGSGLTGPFPSRPNTPRGGGISDSYTDADIARAESLSPSLADAMRSGVGGLW